MSARKPSRERGSRGGSRGSEKAKEKDAKSAPASPLPNVEEEVKEVEVPPVEEVKVEEEINPHAVGKDLLKDIFGNIFTSLYTFQSVLSPEELSLVDKSSNGSNDTGIDGFVASSKVKFELEQKTAQLKSVEEFVKQHTWRTFNNQIVPQALPKGDENIFETNMLVDFDKIVETENVAPVHETTKMPQYPVE
eukprot:Phypoly_transcript_21349.p1 GENE.Phypoly_transcript_21349~~Phypoly_transcript_21349.p1  ORF type:complete len:192 (+),score=48.19 Phypoly_transcript_21349:74-649(+)